jgi:hypothetical protein
MTRLTLVDDESLADELDGATLLDDVFRFIGRFVAYPSVNAHVAACALACSHPPHVGVGLDASNCFPVPGTRVGKDARA